MDGDVAGGSGPARSRRDTSRRGRGDGTVLRPPRPHRRRGHAAPPGRRHRSADPGTEQLQPGHVVCQAPSQGDSRPCASRNGLALLLYREERYTDAIQVMTEALAMLGDAESGIHRSVLLNNLGRVHAVVDGHEKEAERTLRAAIAIDPTFAEYHLDLAMLLTRCQRYPEAVEAADAAWSCSTTIAEIPALLGYLHARLGDHGRAADEYGRAARLRPGKQEHLIAAAREACEAGDYPLTRRRLLRLDRSEP